MTTRKLLLAALATIAITVGALVFAFAGDADAASCSIDLDTDIVGVLSGDAVTPAFCDEWGRNVGGTAVHQGRPSAAGLEEACAFKVMDVDAKLVLLMPGGTVQELTVAERLCDAADSELRSSGLRRLREES